MKQELIEKYIHPYSWEGNLWVDGGWGSKIMVMDEAEHFDWSEMTVDPRVRMRGLEEAFGYSRSNYPTMVLDIQRPSIPNVNVQVVEEDHCYNVRLKGSSFDKLIEYANRLITGGAKEVQFCLHSYLNEIGPDKNNPLYQLLVTVSEKELTPVIKIMKGYWIPCFEEVVPIAGW